MVLYFLAGQSIVLDTANIDHAKAPYLRNVTLYAPPLNISIPEGCTEPRDKAEGWPIDPIGACGNGYLLRFTEQLRRSEDDAKNLTVSLPYPDESLACEQAVLRCDIWDFRHPAHFITAFLPCWSTWLDYVRENNTDTLLLLVPAADLYRPERRTPSPFVLDWLSVSDCGAEIDGVIHGKYEPLCPLWDRKYVDVTNGRQKGNGWHFDLPKELRLGAMSAGMLRYFNRPEHAYAFRSMGLESYETSGRARLEVSGIAKTASPTFRVLFINRSSGLGKRVVGGDGIATFASDIRAKLQGLGLPPDSISVNETDDFGSWDGRGQMRMMNDHDIIISPHGNQWSSIGFAPECASVLEIYVSAHTLHWGDFTRTDLIFCVPYLLVAAMVCVGWLLPALGYQRWHTGFRSPRWARNISNGTLPRQSE